MKFKIVLATTVAGAWLVAVGAGAAHGGWFGLGGDSSTSGNTGKTKSQKSSSPKPTIGTAKPAPGSGKSTSGGLSNLFGFGSQSSTKQPARKIVNPYGPKPKKESSWWNSWFKPKEPPPPKSTGDWMKLKQVKL